jgi:hypothetical protein
LEFTLVLKVVSAALKKTESIIGFVIVPEIRTLLELDVDVFWQLIKPTMHKVATKAFFKTKQFII